MDLWVVPMHCHCPPPLLPLQWPTLLRVEATVRGEMQEVLTKEVPRKRKGKVGGVEAEVGG